MNPSEITPSTRSVNHVVSRHSAVNDINVFGWRNPSSDPQQNGHQHSYHSWLRGVVVSDVGLINEVNQHRARLVRGWVTV